MRRSSDSSDGHVLEMKSIHASLAHHAMLDQLDHRSHVNSRAEPGHQRPPSAVASALVMTSPCVVALSPRILEAISSFAGARTSK